MQICAACRTRNPDPANFCLNCGIKLEEQEANIKCLACGVENISTAQYCMGCGLNLKENEKSSTKPDEFQVDGDISDFKHDMDILQDFIDDIKKLMSNIKITFPSQEVSDSLIEEKIEEIEAEIRDQKKELDNKLKILNSDIIEIRSIKDEENPQKIKFNMLLDEAKLKRYLDYYKSKQSKAAENRKVTSNNNLKNSSNSKHSPLKGESERVQFSWREKCPLCKSTPLVSGRDKAMLGFKSVATLECDTCGTIFQEKDHKYKLSRTDNIKNPLWIKYKHKTLSEDEWDRIAHGGVSDFEQRKIEAEKIEQEKNELKALRKRDIDNFLSKLHQGEIKLNESQSSPIILKKNEKANLVMEDISFRETRAVRRTRGGYGGPSIRVAKGVSFRLGGISAKSESREELREIDQGSLVLTNKRLIFIGSKRTINIDLRKIMAIEAYKDGIASQRENKQKTEYFVGTDQSKLNFTLDGRSHTITINGNVLKAAIEGSIKRL